jgi:hypothetical protein
MNHATHILRIAQTWIVLSLLQLSFALIPSNVAAQLRIAVMAAPAIQNLTIVEATITDGPNARLLPQLGVVGSYGIGKGFSVRLGLRYEAHGFRVLPFDPLGPAYGRYFQFFRIDYAKAAIGGSYAVRVANRLTLGGAVDMVYGVRCSGSIKKRNADNRLENYRISASYYNNYWGLDMGLTLQYQLPSGIGIALSPTFQTQINKVFDEGSLIYKFVGFAPRVELSFPLSKVK